LAAFRAVNLAGVGAGGFLVFDLLSEQGLIVLGQVTEGLAVKGGANLAVLERIEFRNRVGGSVGYVHGWAGKVRPENEDGENGGGEIVTAWGKEEQAENSPVERQAAKTGTPYRLPCVLDRLPEGL